jgi:hypothetical protein
VLDVSKLSLILTIIIGVVNRVTSIFVQSVLRNVKNVISRIKLLLKEFKKLLD